MLFRSDKPDGVKRAHRNFLKEVVFLLQMNNRLDEANRWMATLKEKYPEALPKDQSVEEYTLKRLTETISDVDHNRKKAVIEGLLKQYFERLLMGDDDRAVGVLNMARRIHEYYNSSVRQRQGVMDLERFDVMYQIIRDRFLDPKEGVAPEYAARLRTLLNLPASAAPTTNAPAPRPNP